MNTQIDAAFQRIKRIRSHRGYGQFLSEAEDTNRWIARCQRESIPSPYSYGPSSRLLSYNGMLVLVSETSHRCYDVFAVDPALLTFNSDAEATNWNTRFSKP